MKPMTYYLMCIYARCIFIVYMYLKKVLELRAIFTVKIHVATHRLYSKMIGYGVNKSIQIQFTVTSIQYLLASRSYGSNLKIH